MARTIPLATPGEILKYEFLEPMKITPYRLATNTGMQPIAVSEIIEGKRSITPETALKLGAFFEMEAEFWMNLQRHYELEKAREAVGEKIIARVTPLRFVSSKESVHPVVKALTRHMTERVAIAAIPARPSAARTPTVAKLAGKVLSSATHVRGVKKPALGTKKKA